MVKAATGQLVTLGTADRKKRDGLISVVTVGERTFIEVGNALRVLRDDKLYLETHVTFEEFCKAIWGYPKSHAYQLMGSAQAASSVSAIADKNTPSSQPAAINEGQARVLAKLKTPQQQATVWAKANETAPKDKAGNPKVTAAIVKKTAQAMGALPPAKPKSAPKDECPKGGKHDADEAGDTDAVEDEVKSKPSANGKPTYDDRIIDKLLGQLVRSLDARAKAYGGQGPKHAACVSSLNEFNSDWDAWRKSGRAK